MSLPDLKDSWNRLSHYYQQEHKIGTGSAHYGVLAPNENQLRLIGKVDGKRILEIGCGGGQNAIAFALQGATCTGIDLAENQLEYARNLAEMEGVTEHVTFKQGEMTEVMHGLAREKQQFDVVYSAYALQYVEDLPACFSAVAVLLQSGGIFAFSFDHPYADILEWNPEQKSAHVKGAYFDRTPSRWNWNGLPFVSFHHQIGDVVAAVVKSGLLLTDLIEPEPTNEMATFLSPGEEELYTLIPATLIVRAIKP